MGFEKRSIKKVPTWVARLPVVLGIGVSPVLGQLHLITGYPTTSSDVETYSSSLLRVGSESGVTRIAELASQAAGTQLIDISYDRDLAVVFTGKGDALAIDLYKGIVAKECHTQGIRGRVTTSYWLADDPGKGLLFDWYMTDPSLQHPAVRGLILDASVPCEGSTVELAPSDIRYVVAHGSAAVAGLVAPFSPIIARLDEKPSSIALALPHLLTSLDCPAPKALLTELNDVSMVLTASDLHVLVITAGAKDTTDHVLVCRKRDKSWRVLPVGGDWPKVRAFGTFLAVTEGLSKDAGHPESAGKAEWNDYMRLTFQNYKAAYPGRLYLYDIDTEKVRKIETNQGDSEVLLVDGNTVYYRVSDRIYSAPIAGDGVGSPQLLAQAEEIRDAHWAFMKH